MIKKTKGYEVYTEKIECKNGRNFDFINDTYLSFNEIIAKGLNFKHHIIKSDGRIHHIEYAEIIEQDNKKTVMHTVLLTDYYVPHFNRGKVFELDAESYITFIHHKPLKEIKKEYEDDNHLYNYIKETLINDYGYELSYDNNNYKGCDATIFDENDNFISMHNKEFEVYKDFQDTQKIGEVKNIIDNESNLVKSLAKHLFKGNAYKGLCFTEKGATGKIRVQYCIK